METSTRMPVLQNPRHEAFARARARGVTLDAAYEMAGFAPGNGHASRLASRPKVAERIGELIVAGEQAAGADSHTVIAALLRLAEAAPSVANPVAILEARLALQDVCNLLNELEEVRGIERNRIIRERKKAARRLETARNRQDPPETARFA